MIKVITFDLDNTLIDYDGVFRAVAGELGIPVDSDASAKSVVRGTLRAGVVILWAGHPLGRGVVARRIRRARGTVRVAVPPAGVVLFTVHIGGHLHAPGWR